jgi:hypothetical protein
MYTGETISETLASVIKDVPDLGALPEATPPSVRRLLRRCLEKDPRRRLQAIGEARFTLEEPIEESAPVAVVVPGRRAMLPWTAAGVLTVLLVLAGSLALIHLREAPASRPLMRFTVPPPDDGRLGNWIAMSPDGRYLGFLAFEAGGATRLWIRSLSSLEERPVAGTEGLVGSLFWSPDSRFLALSSGNRLKKVDISGGPLQTLCELNGTLLGGSWNRGVILFGTMGGPIMRVPEAGGTAVAVTKVESARGEFAHFYPLLLPDGHHFLYYRRSAAENSGIYVGSLDLRPEQQSLKRIQSTDYSPAYAPPQPTGLGYLLFLREGSLMAQAFDERRLETEGEPVLIAGQVGAYYSAALFSVSSNGVLAYATGTTLTARV